MSIQIEKKRAYEEVDGDGVYMEVITRKGKMSFNVHGLSKFDQLYAETQRRVWEEITGTIEWW